MNAEEECALPITMLEAGSNQRVCLLLSGGVESGCLLYRLIEDGTEVHPVYVRSGYRWEDAEEGCADRLCRRAGVELTVVRTDVAVSIDGHWGRSGSVPDEFTPDEAVALPGRNAFLLGAAAVLCESRGLSRIVLGTLSSNPFGDATPRFFAAAGELLSASAGREVLVEAPLAGMTKSGIIAQSAGLPLVETFSCIDPGTGGVHCGRCNKCGERRRAFERAGIPDPTDYSAGR